MTVDTAVVSWVEACSTAWLVDDTAQDWAEEVVVFWVAGVLVGVVGLLAAVEESALLNDWLWNWGSSDEGKGSEEEGEVLHFEDCCGVKVTRIVCYRLLVVVTV